MRVKRTLWLIDTTITGITPAHAGKTFQRGYLGPTCEDHPRACG